MGKYFPPEIIDELMSNVPYEDVLDYYGYPTRGRGKNRGSVCPNCQKDFEHFKINTYKNLANCFVCSWKGNPIQFIQKVESLSFIEAVEKYAHIGRFELPESDAVAKTIISRKEKALLHAAKFYSQFKHDYLLERKISQEVIGKLMIGYAKGGRILKQHLNDLSFSDEELLDFGLITERNGVKMDFFFHCVIIPIINNNKVVDLYGRNVKEGNAKHLYLYGDYILYNIDNVKSKSPGILVESQINALTLITDHFKNVVSCGGASKFTLKHAKQLKAKGISKMYIGYDTGDNSQGGQKGAIETGNILKEVGIESKIIKMPEMTDINEFYISNEKPRAGIIELILGSIPLNEYEARFILDGMDIKWIQNYVYERLTL